MSAEREGEKDNCRVGKVGEEDRTDRRLRYQVSPNNVDWARAWLVA
jgi:hypothetical protein